MANKILFIGSNPSQRSTSVVPFYHDTGSNRVLTGWCSHLETGSIESLHYWNVSHQVTPGNRPLKMCEIHDALPKLLSKIDEICPDKIVTLGKTADTALCMLKLEHYPMPHPSGRNRLLNDPNYVAEKINGLKNYLKPSTEN